MTEKSIKNRIKYICAERTKICIKIFSKSDEKNIRFLKICNIMSRERKRQGKDFRGGGIVRIITEGIIR